MSTRTLLGAACLAAIAAGLAATVPAAPAVADTTADPIGVPSFPHAARAANTAIGVTWGKVPGADGYVVYKYDKKAKKFAAARMLAGGRKSWVDKGEPTGKLQRYKIAAYRMVDGKRVEGKPTYQVSALPYLKDDKVVNAGAIKAVDIEGPVGQPFMQIASSYGIYPGVTGYNPLRVEPSAWGKAADKTVVDDRVHARLLSGSDAVGILMTNPRSPTVGINPKKLGEAKVLLIAHNGNHKTVTVRIKDYAHPDFALGGLDPDSMQHLLLADYAQLVGDITQRCLEIGCVANASLDDQTGELIVTQGTDAQLAAMCEQLLDEFPYPMEITLTHAKAVVFRMWRDPDKSTMPRSVSYIVSNWPGDDLTSYNAVAPYWFA
ncbi:MAG: hypothetical protein LBR32_05145 [Propionibacteriaceae bacterium]|jgi:hypothetical protein|nr:hypothetical protein [Propionibacteriaceae bacterium]